MPMTVTEDAAAALKETLESVEHGPEQVLRLVSGPGDFALALGEPREGDQLVEHEGSVVMAIEDTLSDLLEATTLDVEEGPQGPKLTLVR